MLYICVSLGSPVRVRGHPGWTGHVDTSYDARVPLPPPPHSTREPAPAIYDGKEQVLQISKYISKYLWWTH